MGKTEVLLITVLAVAAFTLYSLQPTSSVENHSFDLWKLKFGKKYNEKEESYRLGVWLKNFAYVESHNKRFEAGLETYNLEMNEFADMESAEFGAKYLISFPTDSVTSKCTGAQAPTANLPDSADWTDTAVTPIKNQGQCGSCWAFSTTGSLEGVYNITQKTQISFSEQQLVDCSHSYGNNGCNGGLMNLSFFYVKDNGITLESKYPYKGTGGTCHYSASDSVWTISDCTEVTVDKELALIAAIAKNPVSVAIQANHLSFQLYKSGVYSGNCGTNLDHGVLAVGYGTANGKNHYKVKNSWGSSWGDKGFIFIERNGDGKGKCGIQMAASYPIA
jgi:cathepsin L